MKIAALCLGGLGLILASTLAVPAGELLHKPPACEPGYKIVEEVTYKEVYHCQCKLVPDTKKKTKWVYSTVEEPFCLHHDGKSGCLHKEDCGGCPWCRGPYCRNLLVKKQVVEECPTTRCVVEKTVEKVPCIIYRKVPCE